VTVPLLHAKAQPTLPITEFNLHSQGENPTPQPKAEQHHSTYRSFDICGGTLTNFGTKSSTGSLRGTHNYNDTTGWVAEVCVL